MPSDIPASKLQLVATGLLLATLSVGCDSRDAIEHAKRRGYDAGYARGIADGKADTISEYRNDTNRRVYAELVWDSNQLGAFEYNIVYLASTTMSSAVLGFALQFVAFRHLRRQGILRDVDGIILRGLPTPSYSALEGTERVTKQ